MSDYRLTPSERETVITINDESKTARVFTWQRRLQKRLAANPDARLIREGIHKDPDDRWMEFEVPKDLVAVRNRRVLSEEQRKHECRRSWRLNKNPGNGAWLVDWLFEK